MALGTLTGAVFGEAAADGIGWIGDLFMELLRMIIVPLVLTSIIAGVATVGGGRTIGRLFSKTLGYYVLSSSVAVFAGLLLVNLIRPGEGSDLAGSVQQELPELSTPSSPVELLSDIVPENVIEAAANADMLAIIFFAIVFGAAISVLPERSRTILTELFDALFQTMMRLTNGIIFFLPIGVFKPDHDDGGDHRFRGFSGSRLVRPHDRRGTDGAPAPRPPPTTHPPRTDQSENSFREHA